MTYQTTNPATGMVVKTFPSTSAAQLAGAAPLSAAGKYAELPGVRLWFTDTGGTGEPVVLLHANTGISGSWAGQADTFAAAGYRVVTFDRRGWGRSLADPATGAQPGSIAGDLDELAAFLHLDRFNLVGVAGGGFAALDYAAWRPDKVRNLVVAASTGLVTEPEIDGFFQRLLIPGFDKLPEAFQELSASYRGGDPAGTAAWVAIQEHARQSGAPSQPLHTPNTFAKLETITAPTLVITADADLLAPPRLMHIWGHHLQRVEWATVAEAGHSVAWERPDIFNSLVLEFFSMHEEKR